MKPPADRERLARELAGLSHLDTSALKERWRKLYGTEPPHRLSHRLLTYAVAYKMQEKTLGGLKPATRRLLTRVAEEAASGQAVSVRPATKAGPGTRLLREWHGTSHEVILLDDGVLFRGKRHRSLSEVARIITGSRWSGPAFFGLKAAGRERTS
jgi:Protein of unknown function (DUF2924)